MLDFVFIVLVLVFFGVSFWYVGPAIGSDLEADEKYPSVSLPSSSPC